MNSSFFIRELPIILSIAVLLATLILYLLYLRKRKQNQRLLESNRDLLRSINKNISEGLYRTTPSGQFLYVNNALARLAGFSSPEEMMKINVKDLYVKPKRRRQLQQLVAEKGRIENEDVEFYKKDGTAFWAMISTTGVRDPMGNIEFYDGVISDISQRREIVEKLQESEERYRTLIETMSEGLVCVNNEDHLQFANHKFYEMLGYTEQELLGRPLMEIIVNPEDREVVKQKNHLRTQFVSDSYELRFVHKSGEQIWVKISGHHLLDKEGNVIGSIGTITDISSLKEAYDELKSSEEKFLAFMNNIPSLSWIKDDKGRFIFMNKKYCDTFKVTEQEAIGKTTQQLFPPNALSPSLAEGDRKVYEEGLKVELVERNDTPDHSGHYWLVSRFPIPTKEGKRYLGGIAFEVTAMIETQEKLEQSLNEKNVLLREIHHRVKNNLQIITSLLNLQARQIKDKELSKFFTESQNRIRTMALIHEKLYQSTDLAYIDFGDYARGICNHLYKSYIIDPSKIKLNLQAENMLIDIEHAVPLGLILTELVANSVKYAFKDREEGNINISLRYDGEWLVMVIHDDGVGLPAGFTLNESKSLGLQLVASLVEQVRGDIEYESKNGTKFIVVVPQKLQLRND